MTSTMGATTMKAAVYHRYGPPDVVQVESVAKPIPAANQVLIRVHAATVCAADWRLRKADPFLIRLMNGLLKPSKAKVLGMEFAGTVELLGSGATNYRVGDQVFGSTGFKFGTHAEYVCAMEDSLSLKPGNTTLEDASAVLFGGITALYFLRKGGIAAGQKILIYGASGSVGVYAVQLAKHFGAHVTAVCSTGNLELVKSLGADEVVDYTREDFSAAGRVYDMVFDTVGCSGFTRSLKCLKRGGPYVRVGGSGSPGAMLAGIFAAQWAAMTGAAKVIGGITKGSAEDQEFLKSLMEAGQLKAVIDRRYSLDQIAEAHRYVEAGHKKGNVVILLETARPQM